MKYSEAPGNPEDPLQAFVQNLVISRLGRSQGMQYKHSCHWFIKWLHYPFPPHGFKAPPSPNGYNPDKLRIECALDLSEPLADQFNSCLKTGRLPSMWCREWCTPDPKPKDGNLKTCDDVRKMLSKSYYNKIFEMFKANGRLRIYDTKFTSTSLLERRSLHWAHHCQTKVQGPQSARYTRDEGSHRRLSRFGFCLL